MSEATNKQRATFPDTSLAAKVRKTLETPLKLSGPRWQNVDKKVVRSDGVNEFHFLNREGFGN